VRIRSGEWESAEVAAMDLGADGIVASRHARDRA
jgi:hypothetical protein